jgi:hypothetical protein
MVFVARQAAIIYPDCGGLQDAARLACSCFTRKLTKVGKPSGLQKAFDVSRLKIAL